jgi:electron transport complex protein RnfB
MMATDVYERLARHLDNLPGGFPRSESGVELRILRRLFTPEDAELALRLTLIPEEPRVVARRAKIPVEETARRLDEMEKRGLIFSLRRDGKPPRYQAQQFVVGFWEAQVNRLNRGLVQDFEEYLPTYADAEFWRKAPQLRTIPVGESLSIQTEVMPYERAEELVRAQKTFAVANCICRQELHILGEGCDKPLESCLSFGMAAEHIVRTGRGRAISQEEALAILHRAEETRLVLQPGNAKEALFICTCCGCCCGLLRSVKRHPKPASIVSSPFVVTLDAETCEGCGACETRCQMEAVYVDDGKAVVNADRCIGCGLCVATCPTDSLSLVRKPEAEQPDVPKDIVDNYIKMGRARGKMGIGELIGMRAKSKFERLLALIK